MTHVTPEIIFQLNMNTLTYREGIRLLYKSETVQERRKLLRAINRDAFSPVKSWRKEVQMIPEDNLLENPHW